MLDWLLNRRRPAATRPPGRGPADVTIAERVRPPGNFHAYPAVSVSLSRDKVPHNNVAQRGLPDPIRYGDEYTFGKPFPWPGAQIDFTWNPEQWRSGPPLGFLRRPRTHPAIHYTPGHMVPFPAPINVEVPPSHAYGSLFATYQGE